MTTRPQRMELADYIRELTTTHTHTEHYTIRINQEWAGRDHHVRVPSLLQQLWANDTPSASVEEGPRPAFASKPAARLDALDTAVRIDIEAARWIRDLGQDEPADTAACLRLLHGLSASTEPDTRRAIEHDVRRWWTRARIVTGWDSPAWEPDNTCPQCAERGTIRIRLAERLGMCTNDACRATWGPETIGLLADHIRVESAMERKPRRGPGPCWCPWPGPTVPDLNYLCRSCGSVRCRHALGERLVASLRARRVAS